MNKVGGRDRADFCLVAKEGVKSHANLLWDLGVVEEARGVTICDELRPGEANALRAAAVNGVPFENAAEADERVPFR